MKKHITTFFCLVAAIGSLMAQVPQSFSFQAVMRDHDTLMANQIVHAKFTITPNDNSDVITYCETQNLTTDANGILRAEIGKGTSCGGRFDQIRWERGEYLLNCRFDYSAIPEYFLTSTTQLISVPYALVSGSAKTSSDWELFYVIYNRRLDTIDSVLNVLRADINSTDSIIRMMRASASPNAPQPANGQVIVKPQAVKSEMKKERNITPKKD
ncbi:MAG: hypothetical protein IKX51_06810 [Bacteroidales bacterium]|nr:hypothetical protein [Bacteroidales bacterium]